MSKGLTEVDCLPVDLDEAVAPVLTRDIKREASRHVQCRFYLALSPVGESLMEQDIKAGCEVLEHIESEALRAGGKTTDILAPASAAHGNDGSTFGKLARGGSWERLALVSGYLAYWSDPGEGQCV